MPITEISYTRAATINLGNFNSARVEISATMHLPEGTSLETAYDQLQKWVEGKVAVEAKKHGSK